MCVPFVPYVKQVIFGVKRYGIIWTCLNNDKPGIPLPEWPDLENDRFATDPDMRKMSIDEIWNCSAPRHTENFNDAAHLSWVHADTFGNLEQPEAHEIEVDTSTPYVLTSVTAGCWKKHWGRNGSRTLLRS